MATAAFINGHLVYRYLFDLPLDEDQRETAFFTVNKHRALLVFHGRIPTVLVASYIQFYCLMLCEAVNEVHEKKERNSGL
jgi:hypothetical protein